MSIVRLLDISDLTVDFINGNQNQRAVDHISFELNESETLAVVGESGSGKTVTALAILRLIPSPPGIVSSGSIIYYGLDRKEHNLGNLTEVGIQELRGKDISMIFQEPMTSLNPVFTCGDQVMESLKIHLGYSRKQARNKTLDLFDEVMLPRPKDILSAFPHQLSGGQKQRVMIAMAMACDPRILIADEPTTALDVSVQKTILDLMKKLQATRKMSILFITHDLNLVSGFADRALVMYKGKIVEQNTISSIFRSPQHLYTRGLIACRPPLHERLKRLPTIDSFMQGDSTFKPSVVSTNERIINHQRLFAQDPLLIVEHLTKEFPGTESFFSRKKESIKAVDRTSFYVYPGETLGIVGESGSGKTTLARVLLELIPASEGRILYKGQDITKLTSGILRKLRKELQIIFQDPYSSLNPRHTIGFSIQEPMKVHHLHGNETRRKEKVMELLVKVGLKPEHYYRYPHEFSGGQRQRICIARVLAVEPQLVICDESVSALDVSIQAQILNLLNDLKNDYGLTYIFISHDLSVVKYMSDRLIVMKNGRIEEIGEADEVYANPRSEYTRELLKAIPIPIFEKIT
ncbi:MAG: ABC transporter ATP-binding protein [Bacteroidales bacterium]|nr:ABC transporter ATP-binding protein [Bacteroidales bacterium]